MKLFLSPHNDDETLFGAYTLLREKPLVVICTDSYIQQNRGEDITAIQRWQETVNAMKILGCSVMRLGLRDDVLDEMALIDKLVCFKNFEEVYAPAEQGGNAQHDLISQAAKIVFRDNLTLYSTYAKGEWYTPGDKEVQMLKAYPELKEKALACYQSQLQLPATKPHFEAVKGKPEWTM